MTWYWEQKPSPGTGGDVDAPGLDALPTALLQRHGARILYPADAAAVSEFPVPRSSVYRTRSLMIPPDLLGQSSLGSINKVLARVGMRLNVSPRRRPIGQGTHLADKLGAVPRATALTTAAGQDRIVPAVVDAWVALQALRAAARFDRHSGIDESDVARISLEHLLVGSAITGSPASDGGGVTGNPASDGGGYSGPDTVGSYMYGGWDARAPVGLYLDAPARQTLADCIARWGRRPVVAVLDTGVRAHWWLDVTKTAGGGYQPDPVDGFVAVDASMQDDIYQLAQAVADSGDQPRQLIKDSWDRPVTANPLIGELDTHTGHGTFIAGILRQVAPDAQVLSIRIMHSDGIVYEGDLVNALSLVAARVAQAIDGDMTQMVDVVSLSLGYFSETPKDQAYTSGLKDVIDILLSLGVAVIAAAGNYSTTRRFYPAALADQPLAPGQAPLISVGALNPNGSKALFSDGGKWITAWAEGAAVVSTFPTDVNGRRGPEIAMPAHPANTVPPGSPLPGKRESLDPDDYSGGFAVWSGTSFSAPRVAGQIADGLLAVDDADGAAVSLREPGADAAIRRIGQALAHIGKQG